MISAALAVLKTDEQRNELSEFYEQNKSKLYSIAFERLHNRQDAEDAVQQAFLEIANKPDKFFSLSINIQRYYVSAIVRNISIDMLKKKNRLKTEEIYDDNSFQSVSELLENSLLYLARKSIRAFVEGRNNE